MASKIAERSIEPLARSIATTIGSSRAHRLAIMVLSEQLSHALRGAAQEIAEQQGTARRLRATLRLARTVASELLSTAKLAPYGVRALLCRRRLQAAGRLRRDSYAEPARCIVDVVSPLSTSFEGGDNGSVVLFVNGGVWSAGEAWQFAPLADTLSTELGARVCVAQYSLFPNALVPAMVDEVAAAVRWADGLRRGSGSLVLVGHSAGAHLATLAVLKMVEEGRAPPALRACVGLAGVYDVAEHYNFETRRGVQRLSTMEAAMGGATQFRALSPLQRLQDRQPQLDDAPQFFLLASHSDATVPASQSREYAAALTAAGADARLMLYQSTSHVDFATGWERRGGKAGGGEKPLLATAATAIGGGELLAHAADVVTICRQACMCRPNDS